MFMQTLYGIRDIHKSGIKEEDFSEVGGGGGLLHYCVYLNTLLSPKALEISECIRVHGALQWDYCYLMV